MNKYMEFGNWLYLVEQEVKSKKVTTKVIKEKTNHIWIYDMSYSMSRELPNMIEQIVKLSKSVPKGDTITLGYFSSEGQYRFIVIGFKITNKADYKFLENTIRKNANPIGCTCFSEIINETENVIDNLSEFSTNFSFAFFTDGYPVVSNYSRELNNINSGIDKIKGKLTTAMFIGYGYYYNKSLMTHMAERIGGMLIHNDNIGDFTPTITRLINLSETSEPKVEVESLVKNPITCYTITEQGIVLLNIEHDNVCVAPEVGKSSYIYYITDDLNVDGEKVDVNNLDFSGDDSFCKGMYGGALVLSQHMKTDIAMELIGVAGDKNFIDKLTNAFVIDEYGKVENEINKAINDSSYRFKTGKDVNYLPSSDAFCVFDLFNVLIDDEDAKFYPCDDRFKYTKISKGTQVDDGYSKFKADKDNESPFNELVWHKSRLNLSIQTTLKGTIQLQERDGKVAKDFGLIQTYPTWCYRNFSFVKDGRPNIKKFYVSTSEDTYRDLKNRGLVIDDTFKKNGVYGLDISSLTSMNRKMAENNTNGTKLCKNVYNEIQLMAKLKVYKWFLKNEFPDDDSKALTFSEEQIAFLESNGILVNKGGLHQPKMKAGVESYDYYIANRFEIKIKSLSSLPSLNAVYKKLNSGKKLTLSESLINTYIGEYELFKNDNDSELEQKKYLEDSIVNTKMELKPIRNDIQLSKFSVILGRVWFQELPSREDTILEVDNNIFTFKLSDETVKI